MQTRSQRNKDLREGELIVRRAIWPMADGRWRPGAVSGDTRPCGASGTWYVTMRGLTISMGIVPDFKYGITLRQQTPKTKDLFEKPEV
jgi:hypothetical protein